MECIQNGFCCEYCRGDSVSNNKFNYIYEVFLPVPRKIVADKLGMGKRNCVGTTTTI